MEFTNFYNNIKTEPVGAPQHYGPPVSSVQHDKQQKVNPFMQWAVASIQGFYFSGPAQGSGATPGPQHPPVTETTGQPQLQQQQQQPNLPSHPPPPCSTPGGQARTEQEEQSRPVAISSTTAQETGRQVVAMQGPNYTMHTMVPLEQHHHQGGDLGDHQQNHGGSIGGPANDTAFPGATLRHNYPVMGGQQGGHHQPDLTKQIVLKQEHTNHHSIKKIYTEENGQVVAYNGSAEQMARHNRGEKVERVYECSDCDKAFTREEHLKRHAKSHTDDPVHTCEVIGCNKSYTRKERLTRHYKVAHLGQEPERPFWCSECGKDFQRKEHLTRHQRNIHGPGGSMESQEYKITPQLQHNPTHQARPLVSTTTNHQTVQQQQTVGGGGGGQGASLRCTYEGCPKTYSRREHLNRHIKLHMGIEPDRPYYCHDCGKTFTRKEHLLRHRRSHTGETPYPCPGTCVTGPECTKQFARKEHLKRHLRAHTGEHPYPCSECGRTFGRRERLLKHLKSHGVGVQVQPKREFKKEPDFVQDIGHGVFGDQTNQLLRMIAQKGPLSPDQLTAAPALPPPEPLQLQSRPTHVTPNGAVTSAETFFTNPDVARALSNPEIVAAFSNPDVVKAFALSPPKRGPGSQTPPTTQVPPQPPTTTSAAARGPDIANSPAVPPELSKLPSGFSIFPVVAPAGQNSQTNTPTNDQPSQAQTGNSYYQAAPSYVASVPGHPRELTTIPMSWAGWPMSGMQAGAAMVNIRSPAKLEPGIETKHWEPSTAYFRSPFT